MCLNLCACSSGLLARETKEVNTMTDKTWGINAPIDAAAKAQAQETAARNDECTQAAIDLVKSLPKESEAHRLAEDVLHARPSPRRITPDKAEVDLFKISRAYLGLERERGEWRDQVAVLEDQVQFEIATRHEYTDRLVRERDALQKTVDSVNKSWSAVVEDSGKWVVKTQARIAELEQWISTNVLWLVGHGCATGDCPHDDANQCARELTLTLCGIVAQARGLLAGDTKNTEKTNDD